jgi:predicted ATP-dependent endonuclease of OLD family
MAHIIDFTIGGLAGRKEVYEERLNRDINVFYGLNGSGKTSLLRILDSAMAGDASRITMVPFETAEVTIHSVDWKREFVRSIEKPRRTPESRRVRREAAPDQISFLTTGIDEDVYHAHRLGFEKFEWKTTPQIKGKEYARGWKHVYLPTWRLYGGTISGSLPTPISRPTEVEREYDWDRYFAEKLMALWNVYSTALLSNVREIQEEGLASVFRSVIAAKQMSQKQRHVDAKMLYRRVDDFLRRQKTRTPLGSIRKFVEKYSSEPLFANVVNNIDDIEQKIEKATASRYQLEELITRMFTGDKTVKFLDTGINVTTNAGEDIGLAALSSGEKHVLGIFIETLLADISALLIDEPEISLHVDWQKDLISFMNRLNPRTQLILATHSPEIMANIPDSKIFRL